MTKTFIKTKTIIRVNRDNKIDLGNGVLIGFGLLMFIMTTIGIIYTARVDKLPPIGIITWVQLFILTTFLMFTALLFQGFEITKIK